MCLPGALAREVRRPTKMTKTKVRRRILLRFYVALPSTMPNITTVIKIHISKTTTTNWYRVNGKASAKGSKRENLHTLKSFTLVRWPVRTSCHPLGMPTARDRRLSDSEPIDRILALGQTNPTQRKFKQWVVSLTMKRRVKRGVSSQIIICSTSPSFLFCGIWRFILVERIKENAKKMEELGLGVAVKTFADSVPEEAKKAPTKKRKKNVTQTPLIITHR